jgi:cytochrome bd ubiquinol oxidase subunit II
VNVLSLELVLAFAMGISLTFYLLMGGADFGGGVWDLFSSGPRARAQRDLIADALAPVWEANHVWLILAIVILFTAFPRAFALISTALHIPLTLVLMGIVFRGSAFTFRTYDLQHDHTYRRWSLVFAIASIITPLVLGVVLGAISSGRIRTVGGRFEGTFLSTWTGVFPFTVGLLAAVLCAYLAAVYLTIEARSRELQDDFRSRAIYSALALVIIAALTLSAARSGAPLLYERFTTSPYCLLIVITTGLNAVLAFAALQLRRYRWARAFAQIQAGLIFWGWTLAQYPFLVVPDLTIHSAATSPSTMRLLVMALIAGGLILAPSFYYLLKVFKSQTPRE